MLKELQAENKPTRGKFVGYRRLDEATKKTNTMVAARQRYKITLTVKIGANKMWWRTTLTAADRNQAIEKGRILLRNDLIHAKSTGYDIEFAEALLVDKAKSRNQITPRG